MYIPSPSYLNTGDNSWQLTAATFVGLMSVPGLAILYGGIVKKNGLSIPLLWFFTLFPLC